MPFHGLTGRAVYRGLYAFSFVTLTLGFGLRVGGRRNVPPAGPVVFAANHQSYLDPWLVALAVAPRKLTHLARSNLFDGSWFDWAIRYLGAVPIERGFGKEGIQTVLGELAGGEAVLIFVEGERTRTGAVQPIKPGISLLVKKANEVPVVPVGIAGAYQMWARHEALPRPNPLVLPSSGRSVAVHIGEPVPPGHYKGAGREEILEDLGKRIREAQAAAGRVRRKFGERPG
jgi:1-acyl-sn-glycerol-3-phosphate acyltransferase